MSEDHGWCASHDERYENVRILPTAESQSQRIAYLEKALAEQTEIADKARAERDGWRRMSNWSWMYGGVIGWLVGVTLCLALSARWAR